MTKTSGDEVLLLMTTEMDINSLCRLQVGGGTKIKSCVALRKQRMQMIVKVRYNINANSKEIN